MKLRSVINTKNKIALAALSMGTLVSANSMAAEPEDFTGTYDMSCQTATLTFKVAYGIGESSQSANGVLAGIDGEVFDYPIELECGDTSPTIDAPEEVEAGLITHCTDNLAIPETWDITCESLAADAVMWAELFADNLSKGVIDQYNLEISSSRNWWERLIGAHPTELTLSRFDEPVKNISTTTYNSGNFNLGDGIRYPIFGGLAGFGCVGGLVDDADGHLFEELDGSHTSTAEESNEAAIVCSQDQGEQMLAVGVTIDLDTTYAGEKVAQ